MPKGQYDRSNRETIAEREAKGTDVAFEQNMARDNKATTRQEFDENAQGPDVTVPKADDRLTIHGLGNYLVKVNVGTFKEKQFFAITINAGIAIIPEEAAVSLGTTLDAISKAFQKMPGYGREYRITGGPGAMTDSETFRFIKASQRLAEKRALHIKQGARGTNQNEL
jgi:hypothetical protein